MFRKILYSLLIIGAVLLAFGAITYAIFSDNVASDDQVFSAGTVDLKVDGEDDFFDTSLDMEDIEPGDNKSQDVSVTNAGSLSVNLWNWIYTWGDLFNCDPNPAANMLVEKALKNDSDSNPEYLEPGGTEVYTLTARLPLAAGNLCQGKTGTMRMFFHAVQESNLEGWECVKLLYKEGPLWIPDPTHTNDPLTLPAHGNKCYQGSPSDGSAEFVINGYNLTPNMPLQIMLNGPGGCTHDDMLIAGDFNLDGTSEDFDAYYRGFWTGSAMSTTCSGTGEGVYAIAYGGSYGSNPDPTAKTDGAGNFSGQWTANFGDPCTVGVSELTTKFLVKQDASPWLEELDELDKQHIDFGCPPE